jgi:hypothetical protein
MREATGPNGMALVKKAHIRLIAPRIGYKG